MRKRAVVQNSKARTPARPATKANEGSSTKALQVESEEARTLEERGNLVSFGDTVEFRMAGVSYTRRLVDPAGRLAEGQISIAAPVGRALLGKKKGEVFIVSVLEEPMSVEVLQIRRN